MICDTCALRAECQVPGEIEAIQNLSWKSGLPTNVCCLIEEAIEKFSQCDYFEKKVDKPLKV